MQADILSLQRATESHREQGRGRTSRRRRAPQPVNFNQLGLTVPLVRPQAHLQPIPQSSIDLWPLLSELTGLIGEAYSKDWKKKSPVSQLIFRISQRAMHSPNLSDDGKKVLKLISAGTLLYGLKQDD